MNRSLLAVLVFGVCSAAGTAYAQDNPAGFYLGAGVGQFNVNIDDINQTDNAIERLDDDDRAWKAFAGYRFGRFFAVEAAYIDFGTPNSRSSASGSSGDYRVKLSGFAPYVIGTLPIGPIELFAKVGYYFYDVDLKVDIDDPLAPDFDSSKSAEDLLYGGGIGATFFQRLNVRLEYERIDSDVIKDADALWLSGAWRF
jgi:Outer membrane protein beta-barrel domain